MEMENIEWVPLRKIVCVYSGKIAWNENPTKGTLDIIKKIEMGQSPPIEIRPFDGAYHALSSSKLVYEAYVRLHMSYVPVVRGEEGKNDPGNSW